jgi:hypothetical protein
MQKVCYTNIRKGVEIMPKFKDGTKVKLSKAGKDYIRESGYKPLEEKEYYLVRCVEENDIDGDFYLLDVSFEDNTGFATGFIEEELEVVEESKLLYLKKR